MQIIDRNIHHCLLREDYLKLPGTSFSQLKETEVPNSLGIQIGSLVHQYILKPSEYKFGYAEIVRPIAGKLIEYVGHTLINNLLCEIPITALFVFDGFSFKWKGIPDMFIFGTIVIDFKIINGSLKSYLERFNYENQLRGYMYGADCSRGLIIAYNKKTKQIEIHWVLPQPGWWGNVIKTKGEVYYG